MIHYLLFIFDVCTRKKNQNRRHWIENKPDQIDEMILVFCLVEEMKWDGTILSHVWIEGEIGTVTLSICLLKPEATSSLISFFFFSLSCSPPHFGPS